MINVRILLLLSFMYTVVPSLYSAAAPGSVESYKISIGPEPFFFRENHLVPYHDSRVKINQPEIKQPEIIPDTEVLVPFDQHGGNFTIINQRDTAELESCQRQWDQAQRELMIMRHQERSLRTRNEFFYDTTVFTTNTSFTMLCSSFATIKALLARNNCVYLQAIETPQWLFKMTAFKSDTCQQLLEIIEIEADDQPALQEIQDGVIQTAFHPITLLLLTGGVLDTYTLNIMFGDSYNLTHYEIDRIAQEAHILGINIMNCPLFVEQMLFQFDLLVEHGLLFSIINIHKLLFREKINDVGEVVGYTQRFYPSVKIYNTFDMLSFLSPQQIHDWAHGCLHTNLIEAYKASIQALSKQTAVQVTSITTERELMRCCAGKKYLLLTGDRLAIPETTVTFPEITTLSLKHDRLEADELRKCMVIFPKITSLTLKNNKDIAFNLRAWLEAMAAQPDQWRALKKLSLKDDAMGRFFTALDTRVIASLTMLEDLTLIHYNELITDCFLKNVPTIRHLNLSIYGYIDVYLIYDQPLETLRLTTSNLLTIDANRLPKNLKIIEINNCFKMDNGDFSGHASLESLTLDANWGLADGQVNLAGLENLTSLIMRGNNNFTWRSLQQIGSLINLKTLKILDGNFSDHDISALSSLANLEEIEIKSQQPLSNETLKELAKLKKLKKITVNNITINDEGLGHLKDMPSLIALSLNGVLNVTQRGIDHLASMPLSVLELVSSSSNNILSYIAQTELVNTIVGLKISWNFKIDDLQKFTHLMFLDLSLGYLSYLTTMLTIPKLRELSWLKVLKIAQKDNESFKTLANAHFQILPV